MGVCRLDEEPSTNWTLSYTFIDVCAAGMMVTQLLDVWRLVIGPIFTSAVPTAQSQVPFIN
jgi:hypothetical protein